jgi:hypothetical protein
MTNTYCYTLKNELMIIVPMMNEDGTHTRIGNTIQGRLLQKVNGAILKVWEENEDMPTITANLKDEERNQLLTSKHRICVQLCHSNKNITCTYKTFGYSPKDIAFILGGIMERFKQNNNKSIVVIGSDGENVVYDGYIYESFHKFVSRVIMDLRFFSEFLDEATQWRSVLEVITTNEKWM